MLTLSQGASRASAVLPPAIDEGDGRGELALAGRSVFALCFVQGASYDYRLIFSHVRAAATDPGLRRRSGLAQVVSDRRNRCVHVAFAHEQPDLLQRRNPRLGDLHRRRGVDFTELGARKRGAGSHVSRRAEQLRGSRPPTVAEARLH
jgi:hypothetical protein